jgi:3-oxoacyl-[acyl-carrier protein] reductase
LDLRLDGQRALVTGGSRGIGRAITLALAEAGATVVACYRDDSEAADSLTRELKETGGSHQLIQADVRKTDDVAGLIEECRTRLGGLDVVVNNAGVDGQASFDELPFDEWRRVLDTNLTALYLVTQAALPLLSDHASVINIGSTAASRGLPGRVHYAATKAGVIGLTRSLCKELGPRGIRVNTVDPGVIETEPEAGLPPEQYNRLRALTPLGRLGRPEDVAGVVLFFASELSRYVSGINLNVDGGI